MSDLTLTINSLYNIEACPSGMCPLHALAPDDDTPVTWIGAATVSTVDDILWFLRQVSLTKAQNEDLRTFARECALDVVYLWDAPEVVLRYLTTGEEREEAYDAAKDAARGAAWGAHAAARDAAWAAATYAARAARDAAASEAVHHERLVKIIGGWDNE